MLRRVEKQKSSPAAALGAFRPGRAVMARVTDAAPAATTRTVKRYNFSLSIARGMSPPPRRCRDLCS